MERITRYRGNNVLVKNLEETIDNERLRNAFSQFGRITSVEVAMEGGSRSKGYGFVCFSTPEEAARAVEGMNGRIIGSKSVECALSEPKEDRQAYLSSLHTRLAQQQGHYRQAGIAKAYIPTQRVHGSAQKSEINSPRWITQSLPIADENAPSCSNTNLPRQLIPEIEVYSIRDDSPDEDLEGAAALVRQVEVPLTESDLIGVSPEEQKIILGARLNPLIQGICHEWVGKITAMILDLDNSKILDMLKNYDSLKSKVEEALKVLNATMLFTKTAKKPKKE